MPLAARADAEALRQKRAAENEPPALEPEFPFEPQLTLDPFYFGLERVVEPIQKLSS